MRFLGLLVYLTAAGNLCIAVSTAASKRGLQFVHDVATLTDSASATPALALSGAESRLTSGDASSVGKSWQFMDAKLAQVEQEAEQEHQVMTAQQKAINALLSQQQKILTAEETLVTVQKQLELHESAEAAQLRSFAAHNKVSSRRRGGHGFDRDRKKIKETNNGSSTPFEPLHPSSQKFDNFPDKPPKQLAFSSETTTNYTISGVHGTDVDSRQKGLRLDLSSDRGITIADELGNYLFAGCHIETASWVDQTAHFFDANTGRRLALIRPDRFSLHRILEVASYIPFCKDQEPWEEHDEIDIVVYPFLRLTKRLLAATASYSLQRYDCDGELRNVFDIDSRHLLQWKRRFDFYEDEHTLPVATMDQVNTFSSQTWDIWGTNGMDVSFLSLAASLVYLDIWGTDEVAVTSEVALGTPAE